MVKNQVANAGDVRSLGWEDPLEEGMATHSSILVWRIPWTEEPGGLQFLVKYISQKSSVKRNVAETINLVSGGPN